jgi:hypothetical protein
MTHFELAVFDQHLHFVGELNLCREQSA